MSFRSSNKTGIRMYSSRSARGIVSSIRPHAEREEYVLLEFLSHFSDLENRVEAILDTCRKRRSLTRRMSLALLTIAIVLVIPCTIPRLGYAQVETKANSPGGKFASISEKNGAITEEKEPAMQNKIVRGKVVDEFAKPIAEADVWLPVVSDYVKPADSLVAHTKTDVQGRFTLEIPGEWLANKRFTAVQTAVLAYKTGRCIGTGNANKAMFQDDSDDIVIELGSPSDTSFIVLNPDGKPLEGALVAAKNFDQQLHHATLPEELMQLVSARTDAAGLVRLPAVPRKGLGCLRITAEGFGVQLRDLSTLSKPDERAIKLRPVGRVLGRIIAEKPEYAGHLWISLTTWAEFTKASQSKAIQSPVGEARVRTDSDGEFEVPAIAEGTLAIRVFEEESIPVLPRLPKQPAVKAGQTKLLEIPMVPAVKAHGQIRFQGTFDPICEARIHIYYNPDHFKLDVIQVDPLIIRTIREQIKVRLLRYQ